MKQLNIDNEILEKFTYLIERVKLASAVRRTDINRVVQSLIAPILAELYGYNDLRDLDAGPDGDYPGIDLADDVANSRAGDVNVHN